MKNKEVEKNSTQRILSKACPTFTKTFLEISSLNFWENVLGTEKSGTSLQGVHHFISGMKLTKQFSKRT